MKWCEVNYKYSIEGKRFSKFYYVCFENELNLNIGNLSSLIKLPKSACIESIFFNQFVDLQDIKKYFKEVHDVI